MKMVSDTKGQGTVEAAVVIPILFLLILLLLQPGIVLYDYIVMQNAAAEGARLAATSKGEELAGSCTQFIRNRLSAIPQQDLFHIHDGYCSYEIEISGGEETDYSEVKITNQLRPLPLFDITLGLLGATNGNGMIQLRVNCIQRNQPDWVSNATSHSPSQWVEDWTR